MSESLQDIPSQLKNIEHDYIKVATVHYLIIMLVISIPLLILAFFQLDNPIIVSLVSLVVAFLVFSIFFFPKREYIHTKYGLINDVFYVQEGIWFKKRTAVAQNRIQHTDVDQGPVARRYDLATLTIHTAGMAEANIKVPGLKHVDAIAMRDHLIHLNKQLMNSQRDQQRGEKHPSGLASSLAPTEHSMATSVLALRPSPMLTEEE